MGLEYIKIIHKIIQTIQTHRADMNSYLNGNMDKQESILEDEELWI